MQVMHKNKNNLVHFDIIPYAVPSGKTLQKVFFQIEKSSVQHQCFSSMFSKALMIKKKTAMIGNITNKEISCQRRSMQIKRPFAGYTCYLTLLLSLPWNDYGHWTQLISLRGVIWAHYTSLIPVTFYWSTYTKPRKAAVMYMCFSLFLRMFYWILTLFRQCGIFLFSFYS